MLLATNLGVDWSAVFQPIFDFCISRRRLPSQYVDPVNAKAPKPSVTSRTLHGAACFDSLNEESCGPFVVA